MATAITLKGKVGITGAPFTSGDDFNQIYLTDVGRRSSLGGSQGIYTLGQDQYLNPGETIQLQDTGAVTLSKATGLIKKLLDLGLVSLDLFPNFNSLLSKLDLDTGIGDNDYSTLALILDADGLSLVEFITGFDSLLAKLDADTGVTDLNYVSLLGGTIIFSSFFTNYNDLLAKLDLDAGVNDTNYAALLVAT